MIPNVQNPIVVTDLYTTIQWQHSMKAGWVVEYKGEGIVQGMLDWPQFYDGTGLGGLWCLEVGL